MITHSLVFYDGTCGLCHHAVRFAIARDGDGSRFRFAPLGGQAFCRLVPEAATARVPDSILVLTPEGALLTRSGAIAHILGRIGGGWGWTGRALGFIPLRIRDVGYDAVASVRHRLFRRPVDACPVTPPALRARFEE